MRSTWITVSLTASLALVPHALSQENVQAPAEIELPEGPAEDTAETEPEQPAPPPWDGTFAEGMAEVVRLAASEDDAAAMEVADRLLEDTRYARLRTSLETRTRGWSERALGRLEQPLTWLGYETLGGADRAEVRYARGLLYARSGAVISADEDLDVARVLAGDGATRQDAVYALGTLDLAVAEELRQKIPEISGAQPNQVPGPAAGLPGAPPEEEPDPLELARAAYGAAREHFVERLRLDWRDANTRANVELVQRRLRELDEILRDREEQEQEQQQNEQEQDQEQDPDQEGEDQESDDEQEQDAEQDPEQDKEPEEKDPEEQDSEEEQESESEEQEGEPEERYLTEEEMQRLLQLLRQYSEQGEELEKTLQGVRRERVDRDW